MWLHSLKVAQLLRSAACLHTNQSRSYLNHLVFCKVASHVWKDSAASLQNDLCCLHDVTAHKSLKHKNVVSSFYLCVFYLFLPFVTFFPSCSFPYFSLVFLPKTRVFAKFQAAFFAKSHDKFNDYSECLCLLLFNVWYVCC